MTAPFGCPAEDIVHTALGHRSSEADKSHIGRLVDVDRLDGCEFGECLVNPSP
jgi:hypothetical protein